MSSRTNPPYPPRPPAGPRRIRKPSSSTRRVHEGDDRFTRNVTIGFVVVIAVVAVAVILGLAYGYWDANLKPLANVEGTEIGRAELQDRQALEAFRAGRIDTTTRAALLAGDIDEDLANSRLTAASQAGNAGASGAMESLVDLHLKQRLAEERGISLTDAELADAIAADGTLPEERRVGAVLVQPVGADTGTSTAQDTATARATAEEALAALRSGTLLADVVAEYSPATAGTDGDLGFYTLEQAQGIDPTWAEALFALDEGGSTDVVETDYGMLIGVASQIVPATPDEGFLAAVNEQVGEGIHRRNVELETLATKLEDDYNADAASRDYDQVRLAEIVVAGDTLVKPEDQQPSIRARHILYAPEPDASPSPDASASPEAPAASTSPGASSAPAASPSPDAAASTPPNASASAAPSASTSAAPAAPASSSAAPSTPASASPSASPSAAPSASPASSSSSAAASPVASASAAPSASPDPNASPTPIPADDPSWGVARSEAEAAAAELRAMPDVDTRRQAFAEMAKNVSDDETSGARGGDLGFFERSDMVEPFADAVFDAQDPQPGDIIGPVRSDFGWHVIMFEEARATLAERLAAVQDALAADGADFADVARDLSDAASAEDGGEIGWQVLEDLDEIMQLALTAIDVGERTEPIDEQRGYAIYQKEEEATRPLEPDAAAVKAVTAFDTWYEEQRAQAEDAGEITIDGSVSATGTGA